MLHDHVWTFHVKYCLLLTPDGIMRKGSTVGSVWWSCVLVPCQVYFYSILWLAIPLSILSGIVLANIGLSLTHDARCAAATLYTGVQPHCNLTKLCMCTCMLAYCASPYVCSHFAITHKPWVWKILGAANDFCVGVSQYVWTHQVCGAPTQSYKCGSDRECCENERALKCKLHPQIYKTVRVHMQSLWR